MKANDKAIEAARAESKRWRVGLNRPEDQITWKVLREDNFGYDIIARCDSREERDEALERFRAEAMVTAAYAAQFQSEDYAGLVERLRKDLFGVSGDDIISAADALEAVMAEREAWKGRQEATAAILKRVEAERDALAARLEPVDDDDELVEIAAETWIEATTGLARRPSAYTISERAGARAAIAAIRPHIEAAEREKWQKMLARMGAGTTKTGAGNE